MSGLNSLLQSLRETTFRAASECRDHSFNSYLRSLRRLRKQPAIAVRRKRHGLEHVCHRVPPAKKAGARSRYVAAFADAPFFPWGDKRGTGAAEVTVIVKQTVIGVRQIADDCNSVLKGIRTRLTAQHPLAVIVNDDVPDGCQADRTSRVGMAWRLK